MPCNIQRLNKIGEISLQHYITRPSGAAAPKNSQAASTSRTKTETSQPHPKQSKAIPYKPFSAGKTILLDSLRTIGKILKEMPSLMLVLVWDIDGTILYAPPDWGTEDEHLIEITLISLIASSFESWRKNGQLLLILNTARHYDEFNFFDPSFHLPRADFIITDGGARYFVNNTLATGFSLETSKPVNSCPGIEHTRITLPTTAVPSCTHVLNSSTLEYKCRYVTGTELLLQAFQLTPLSAQGFDFWHQPAPAANRNHILLAYHPYINKGAAFARLIHDMTNQDTDFQNKTKWVATAGDALMDTAMMNERMNYPFNNRQSDSLSPGLPANTTYIGTVLSKAGKLQRSRFKSLFNEQTTVHSKARSIVGIVEGTAQLLKRQLFRLLMPPAPQ